MLATIDWYGTLLIPLLIFVARIIELSVGTTRIVFISKGMAPWAAVAAFFEVVVWLLAISQVLTGEASLVQYAAFAAGYSAGNYLGIRLEERLALGKVMIRLITARPANALMARLNQEGYGATLIAGQGARGPVSVLYCIIPRRRTRQVLPLVEEYHPKSFVSIEPVTRADQGVFPINVPRPTAISSQQSTDT